MCNETGFRVLRSVEKGNRTVTEVAVMTVDGWAQEVRYDHAEDWCEYGRGSRTHSFYDYREQPGGPPVIRCALCGYASVR